MKAIRVHSYGQPPRLDDVPEPQAAGPEDVNLDAMDDQAQTS